MRMILPAIYLLLWCSLTDAAEIAQRDHSELLPRPVDLMDNVPKDFPRFYIEGDERTAQLINRYLWYHFSTRLGYSNVLFNMEYLTTSDLWMGGALRPGWPKTYQGLLRELLLSIELDPEGYVHTNQHFSHAHEQGWPFPLWIHGPTGAEGYGAGWHFQQDGPGWVWDSLRKHPDSPFAREKAIEGWALENVKSEGIEENKWKLVSMGPSPAITTPEGVRIRSFNAPFLQLRWTRTGTPTAGRLPYVEWLRENDSEFSAERRVYFGFDTGNPVYEQTSGTTHSMITMYRHPLWDGTIKRIRISLAPGEEGVEFAIDSFFTVYDTRHTINNPIYVLSCWNYFRWTNDIDFLKNVANRMRKALAYQQTELGGLEYKHIRNPWVGHTGISGLELTADGKKIIHTGQGIGSNYWDILPLGWDDMYATSQYYASTLAMADAEQAILNHPGWSVARGAQAFVPEALRAHAAEVKETANRVFWNADAGRFYGCIDQNGVPHDYGFTFLNLDAIWYGIASDEHARSIMQWLNGDRIVEGDTSTGADIYRWQFGPRATTKRNIEWYGFMWTGPEKIPWGGQVQDGGAVLGFSFYDLWARFKLHGADNTWTRLQGLLAWEEEVWSEGGYRKYYEDGKHGTTMQGGGTAGGVGIDAEFFESSLVPSIVVYGFLGIDATPDGLAIHPRLPQACPRIGAMNLIFRDTLFDLVATLHSVEVRLQSSPHDPIPIRLGADYTQTDTGQKGRVFYLAEKGRYRFELTGSN